MALKLLVIAAAGGLGRQVVLEALSRGHSVSVLVRAPSKLDAALGPAEAFFLGARGGPLDPAIAAFVVDDLAAATFTPYVGASVGGVAGAVDLAAVDAHCADLASHGVRTAFINGTTGDSMCLTQAERRGLHEAWVAAGRKYGVRVLAHIGSSSITEACELAAHAQASGCDAICAMAPSFFKPRDAHALALWLQAIGAAAPKMPLYYCASLVEQRGGARCESGARR